MDDGFDWIEGLDPAIGGQLNRLIDLVADGEHGAVDALVPSVVALAREHGNAWVEVFARNFELRSLILHRENTRDGLPKAVALLDRAHEPDTRDCPQSICTAHAVCAAYGHRDGRGFVQERLRVSAETLARTDPRRICWICITNEHADALIDSGEPQQALDFMAKNADTRHATGAEIDPDDFGLRATHALLALGRPEDALAELEGAACTYRGHSWQRTWRQWKARVLVDLGQHEAAVEHLSPVEDILDDGGFRLHFETLERLFGSGAMSDDLVLGQTCRLARAALERGVARASVEALSWAAERLLGQGERTLGEAAVELARTALPDLADATQATARLEAVAARLAALDPLPPRDTAADTPENFESALALLAAGGDPALARAVANLWNGFGWPERGFLVLREAFARHPDHDLLYDGLCDASANAGDYDTLEALLNAPSTGPDGPALGLWHRASMERAQGGDGVDTLHALFDLRPDWYGAADLLGKTLFAADRIKEAATVWAGAADTTDHPNSYDWSHLACATALEDWETVRSLCRTIGYEVAPGDAPLIVDLGLVLVYFDDDPDPYRARRTSPALAEVMSMRAPGSPQRVGDTVLIHPWPENADELDEGEDSPAPAHRVLKTLVSRAQTCVAIDGRHPGEPAAERLWHALDEAGFHVQIAADEDYVVTNPDTAEYEPGMYWLVALTPDRADALIALFEAIEGPGPRVWYDLLGLAGRVEEAEAQLAVALEWDML